jgi:23S rRNA (cytosine1962-C5)-methyltransferase
MHDLLEEARTRRTSLLGRLASEHTDTYRLFHGIVEGRPGLTIDRYGENILVQTFRELLSDEDRATIEATYKRPTVWRHRGADRPAGYEWPNWAWKKHRFVEFGVRWDAPMVHRGQDPYLFLDLRAGRRWIHANSDGKTVLNTFAYTGGSGLIAAAGGAAKTTQLDHGNWCLEVADEMATANGHTVETVREDFFAAMRQWAGLPIKGRGVKRQRYTKRPERRFDLVILDPPTFTKSRFGVCDIVRDYASLAKPSLMCVNEGGTLLATNHAASVAVEDWIDGVKRAGAKIGRPVLDVQLIEPDADFPTFDGRAPLKTAVFQL